MPLPGKLIEPALDGVAAEAADALGDGGAALLAERARRYLPDALGPLQQLYGERVELDALLGELLRVLIARAAGRPESARAADADREADPAWFQGPATVGYVCYADRFGGTLEGVRSHLDHLAELGASYLHLMPVLAPRAGENDGGYAVRDWDEVDPRLGTMADLGALADELHARGMVLCLDFVLNHTAREHEWAQRALAGDAHYRDFYLVFGDRELPDAYERTVPDIFPDMAPGSFTHVPELGGWVWTTFREFQWDLDYANPDVFVAMLDTVLGLANRGADVLRLDAAPFLWKRLGTNCQDQPEVHLLLQAFRALTRVVAPGVLLKAEAMLAPELLGRYLGDQGDHEPYRAECDLAYDNQLMVMLWSAFATGDARLPAQALARRRPAPAAASWVTYLRCHDDIGWAVSDVDAAAVGLDGTAQRRFLADFYAGDVAGSFARGARFQRNAEGADPTSGSAASLCGIDAALAEDDGAALALGLARLESAYAVVLSFGGIPLIYMGDELALRNDRAWADDPAHVADNRWMHRPPMDWAAASEAVDVTTLAGRAFDQLRRAVAARRACPVLGSSAAVRVLGTGNDAVFGYARGEPGQFVALVNASGQPQRIVGSALAVAGVASPRLLHSGRGDVRIDDDGVTLPPCGFAWLTA